MVISGSKSKFGFFVEGQSFMTQGSYEIEAAHMSPEDYFGLNGCHDIAKEAKEADDDIHDWIFEEGPVDDDEESAGSDVEGLFGMENFHQQHQFVGSIEASEALVKEVCETTVDLNGIDLNGILFDTFSFTDSDTEAETSQSQGAMMAFEGANVSEVDTSCFVGNLLPAISPASSLALLSVQNFSELLPNAYSHNADLDLDLQFTVPVHSDALPAYPDPQHALVQQSSEEKFFTDFLNDESYALAYFQQDFDFNIVTNTDAFAGVNTNVPAGHESCLDIGGQYSEPICEKTENVVGSEVGLDEPSDTSSNEFSDLSLVYPTNMSHENVFQTETGAMMLDANSSPDESMSAEASDYTHTPASGGSSGGAEDLGPTLEENNMSPQSFSDVPRNISDTFLLANPNGSAGFKVKIKDVAAFEKKEYPSELLDQQNCTNIQNAIKGAVAKGHKKGPQSPRERIPSASSSTARVTKPRGTKPKKPRRVKRVFDYSEAEVDTIEVPCPELRNILITREQLIEICGENFDEKKAKEGEVNRRRFVRGSLDGLKGLHPDVAYEKNRLFDISRPYQQEFTRVELNPSTGAPIMETRSGLCCYCEELHFYELKNSCYSQHMSHSHGVYTDNYLTPDAIFPGQYNLSKKSSPERKTIPHARDHEGVVCPVCLDVIETRCWSSTSDKKPLSNYLRHFKDQHRVGERKETFSTCKLDVMASYREHGSGS